jgi:hypothetical protein
MTISSLVVRTGPHFDGLYIIAQKRRMSGTFRIKVRAQTKDDLWTSLIVSRCIYEDFSMLYGYIFFDIFLTRVYIFFNLFTHQVKLY